MPQDEDLCCRIIIRGSQSTNPSKTVKLSQFSFYFTGEFNRNICAILKPDSYNTFTWGGQVHLSPQFEKHAFPQMVQQFWVCFFQCTFAVSFSQLSLYIYFSFAFITVCLGLSSSWLFMIVSCCTELLPLFFSSQHSQSASLSERS